MRQLKNLNYIEMTINEIENKPEESEHIELKSFDIANNHPSEYLYLLFLDLTGYIIKGDYKFDFSFSIDMFSNNRLDLEAENIIDLVGVEKMIKREFSSRESKLRIFIEKEIDYLMSNLEIELEGDNQW